MIPLNKTLRTWLLSKVNGTLLTSDVILFALRVVHSSRQSSGRSSHGEERPCQTRRVSCSVTVCVLSYLAVLNVISDLFCIIMLFAVGTFFSSLRMLDSRIALSISSLISALKPSLY